MAFAEVFIDHGTNRDSSWLGFGVGFRFGLGAALTAMPLFQTSFVPDLTQVNFLPEAVEVDPAFVHLAPALAAANDGAANSDIDTMRARNKRVRVMR